MYTYLLLKYVFYNKHNLNTDKNTFSRTLSIRQLPSWRLLKTIVFFRLRRAYQMVQYQDIASLAVKGHVHWTPQWPYSCLLKETNLHKRTLNSNPNFLFYFLLGLKLFSQPNHMCGAMVIISLKWHENELNDRFSDQIT